MGYVRLTNLGKEFIRRICASRDVLSGNNGKLPFSQLASNTVFTSNAKDRNGNTITSSSAFAEELIYWFDQYSQLYDLDANIIAAQSYQESGYQAWIYANYPSSAAGITQFLGSTVWEVVVVQQGISRNVTPAFTQSEINRITNGITNPTQLSSYKYGSSIINPNREILFQNIIDNPDLMIKAQCKYMRAIRDRCNGIAASALFCYNRGPAFARKTYTETVLNCQSRKSSEYIK